MLSTELHLLSDYEVVNTDVDLLEILDNNIAHFNELGDYEQSQVVYVCKEAVKTNTAGIYTEIYLGRCPQKDTRTYTLVGYGVYDEGDYIKDGDKLGIDVFKDFCK